MKRDLILKIVAVMAVIMPLTATAAGDSDTLRRFAGPLGRPVAESLSRPYRPSEGMYGHHVAVWNSHGRYFNNRGSI